jgi:hypothetical protein
MNESASSVFRSLRQGKLTGRNPLPTDPSRSFKVPDLPGCCCSLVAALQTLKIDRLLHIENPLHEEARDIGEHV